MNIDSIKNQFHDIGLLANQTSWYPSKNAYLAQVLDKHLKRVFVPEHGFFAELQDQETLDDTLAYNFLNPYAEFVSVYGSDKQHTLRFTSSQLSDLDCIIVDIQDVGVRYFTYITTMFYLFEALKNNDISIPVFVTNRPNPNIGRVEGTPLQAAYQSFI
ncbi:MAG: exo-beta-N-acetylmuramidase NamZ domain-containing protein, partial [Flavisolibacter sp.]